MPRGRAKYVIALLLAVVGLMSWTSLSYGQADTARHFRHQLSVQSINDSFMPPWQDYYYTNGLHLQYSQLVKDDFLFKRFFSALHRKQILRFTLGHEIYTPRRTRTRLVSKIDRPYAGYLFLTSTLDTFWKRNNNLALALTLGVIGPASGGEWVQKRWHTWFGLPQPLGWEYQVKNVPVININGRYRHAFSLVPHADVIPSAAVQAGTAFNNVSVGTKLRFGHINTLDYSSVSGSQLQYATHRFPPDHHTHEWFVFAGVDNTLVLYNALIEGNVFDHSEQVYIKDSEPYLLTLYGGFEYALPGISWQLIMKQMGSEVVGGDRHNVVSLNVAVRF